MIGTEASRVSIRISLPRQDRDVAEAIANTGAVTMGRRAYEMANGDFTGYEFQVPIFVVTHHPPKVSAKGENARLSLD